MQQQPEMREATALPGQELRHTPSFREGAKKINGRQRSGYRPDERVRVPKHPGCAAAVAAAAAAAAAEERKKVQGRASSTRERTAYTVRRARNIHSQEPCWGVGEKRNRDRRGSKQASTQALGACLSAKSEAPDSTPWPIYYPGLQ